MKLKDIFYLFKETLSEWSEDKAARLAAALSYYTIFALAPLLVIAIAIAGLVFERTNVEEQLLTQINGLVGQQGRELVAGLITNTFSSEGKNIIATIVGIVTLVFGASGVFGQLQDSLNTIWEVTPKPGGGILAFAQKRFLSFTAVLGIGFLLLVSLFITTALSALGQFMEGLFPGFEFVMQVINFIISFGVITLLFALIFKILPDAEIAWKDVWLGAAVTTLLFMVGQFAIGLYLGNNQSLSAYGAAASVIIILLWVYYSAQILFIGAEFTQVYANKFGSRIVPEPGAMAVTEEQRAQQGLIRREGPEAAGPEREAPGGVPGQNAPDMRTPGVIAPVTGGVAQASTAKAAYEPVRRITPLETIHPPDLLEEARPSVLAFSAILAALVGFISGTVMRGRPRSKKR